MHSMCACLNNGPSSTEHSQQRHRYPPVAPACQLLPKCSLLLFANASIFHKLKCFTLIGARSGENLSFLFYDVCCFRLSKVNVTSAR